MANYNNFEIEPLSRTQILVVMAVTAVVLLTVSKIWQKLGNVTMLPLQFDTHALIWSISLALGIIVASSIIYRLWSAYRHSADIYLELVVKPLVLDRFNLVGIITRFK
jgi:uncharacterized protein